MNEPNVKTEGADQILRDLRALELIFDLLNNRLGESLINAGIQGIKEMSAAEVDPDGQPWPDLSEGYEEWKLTIDPTAPIGVLHGLMLDDEQLRGIREFGPYQATATYGVSEDAAIEAVKFQEGGAVTGTNQPGRPFYYLNLVGVAAMDEITTRTFYAALGI